MLQEDVGKLSNLLCQNAAASQVVRHGEYAFASPLISPYWDRSAAGAQPGGPADLILVNGRVYTVDAAPLGRSGRDPRVANRGSGHQRRRAGLHRGGTRTIDLEGAFVSPGFNDAHVHIDSTGALLVGVNLLDVHEPAFDADA